MIHTLFSQAENPIDHPWLIKRLAYVCDVVDRLEKQEKKMRTKEEKKILK